MSAPSATAALGAGLVAGYGVAVPVGAVAAYLVGFAASGAPVRARVGAALGVACADGLYAGVAALGGAALGRAVARCAGPLHWAAAVVLLTLAVRTAVAAVGRFRDRARLSGAPAAGAPDGSAAGVFLRFLALTAANPLTVVYFAALVVGGHGAATQGG